MRPEGRCGVGSRPSGVWQNEASFWAISLVWWMARWSSPRGTSGSAPAAGKQAPGFYRYKVGAYECTSINDGARSFPMPDTFVRNVPKEEALAAAEAAYMPKGMVTIPFNPQLINTGGKLVLIDCGNGIAAFEPTKGAAGRTLQNLAAAGVDPKSVDMC